MADEDFINQLRKFLREVGVTSQQEIEKAVAASKKAGQVRLRMHLTSPDIPLDHAVERTIEIE